MKQAGVALVVVFLLYVTTSFVDPLLVGCVEIVFLMWLYQYSTMVCVEAILI